MIHEEVESPKRIRTLQLADLLYLVPIWDLTRRRTGLLLHHIALHQRTLPQQQKRMLIEPDRPKKVGRSQNSEIKQTEQVKVV